MTTKTFWSLLGGTILIAGALLLLLDVLLPQSDAVSQFTMICTAVFVLINVLAYYLGIGAARSDNKYRFIHLMMILILVKMMICVALVLIYVRIGQPATKLFVIPFLAIYIIFTIFEIYVLQRVARIKPGSGSGGQEVQI
ncbi:MAG: hypothetical protein R3301_04485 [Saprospiraceae bacterium]|nr:hypothetical protein [Saprospiraceae bacterium]